MTEQIYNSKDYKISRKAYSGQCAFEYLGTLLVTDAFLATLLSYIGISDSLIGIISSIISLAFLFQLSSIFLVSKVKNIKKIAVISNTVSMFLFMMLYIVPFIPISKTGKTILFIAFILLAYILNYTVTGVVFKWGNSFVHPQKRAEYSATKEMISLVSGIVFTLIMGFLIDKFAADDNISGGFLFSALTMLILSVCNFVCFMLIKRKNETEEENEIEEKVKFGEILKNTFGNKNFVHVMIMSVMHYAATYMTIGFLGIFKTKDLLISVGAVQVINIIGDVVRIFFSRVFGRFSDKHSYATGMKCAFLISAASYLILAFTTPKSWWCIVIYTLLYKLSLAGINQNSLNIVYSYVDKKYFVQATAIKNSISGICGFLISLVAGKILAAVQGNGNMVFGIHMYGQQLLAIISFVIICLAALYVKMVIEKQSVKIQ